jgi:hypothetical protein
MDLPFVTPAPGRHPIAGPCYCPRCGRVGRGESTLCADCGEALARQGYCPVCEAYWPLAPGTPCPKHELALEAGATGTIAGRAETINQAWVTVKGFADALGAEAARIRLEAEGIPTFLEGERMGSPSMYQVATGGVKLQVPESLAADARILLAQSWTPPADDDLDDAWDQLAPDAHATRRDLGRAAVLFVLLAPLLLSLLSLWLNRR